MKIKEAKKLLEEMHHVEWNDPACMAALDLALSLIDREAIVRASAESELVEEALPARERLETRERNKPYARRERVTPKERAEAIRQAKVMQLDVLNQRAAYLQKVLPQPNQVNADRCDHLAELDDLQELERVLIQADALDRELRPELYEAPTGAARALAEQQASDERHLLHEPLLVGTRVRLLENYEDEGARKGDTGCIIEVFEGSRRAKVEWDDNGGGWNVLPTHDLIEIRRTPAEKGEST